MVMRAAIIGGGVAGSAAAIALRRGCVDVTVHEAYENPAGPVGSFVSIAANGLRALDTLGCLPAVRGAGFPVARQRMWSGRGRPLGDVPCGRRGDDPLHSVTLQRADLVTALRRRALDAGARIVTGARVAAADLDADLVVGADGIWSTTRRALDPGAPAPAYAGLFSVSGTSDRLPPGLPPTDFNWVFARRGVFIYLPAPDGSVWWTAQVASRTAPADPAAIGVAALADTFATEPAVTAILRADARVRAATLMHTLAPVHRRHDDRTVLVGDAARPAGAGQGASMALEDAIVLARRLAAAAAIPSALAGFDHERQPRAGRLAKAEATNRDAKTAGWLGSRARELI